MMITDKPWTMELSKLTVQRAVRDEREGLLVTAHVSTEAEIYCFVPLSREALTDNLTTAINVLSADLTNAFDLILWMWNHPEEAEREGCMDPGSGTKIRAWRDKAGLQ